MINTVVIMGRLTADPEIRTTTSGISVTSFTVAVDRQYANNGKRETDFIDCVAWRNTAEFVCKYFRKGQMIAVRGAVQTSNFEDKNGNKRKKTEVVADEVSFCGSKGEDSQGGETVFRQHPASVNVDEGTFTEIPDEDDLPF